MMRHLCLQINPSCVTGVMATASQKLCLLPLALPLSVRNTVCSTHHSEIPSLLCFSLFIF
uniref:Uncharacterized protein n=1 Tax=Anguilla anguilla TaxID=7936 RepID=A0A0E9WA39_ANGAN